MRLIAIALLLSFNGFSQSKIASSTSLDIQMIEERLKENGGNVTEELKNLFPINRINGIAYVSFIAKVNAVFSADDLNNENAFIGSRSNNIISIHYPLSNIGDIRSVENIQCLKMAAKIKPNLDNVVVGTRVDSVWAGYGLPQGYTGKDVLIGITDWGFDYTSPMFYDTLLQSTRILAAWDQFKTEGTTPANYNYGAEYATESDLLNAGSDTANIYSFATHGSHVAGIAGGSGAGLNYRGMAFESQFLFTTFMFNEAAVLDAWSWLKEKADQEGKRLVVNMSWGIYHFSTLDGSSLLSQALDDYSNNGVLFITSAGNNGDVNFHIKKEFNADTLKTRVNFYSNPSLSTLWGQSLHMWGEAGNSFESQLIVGNSLSSITAETPWYNTIDNIQVDSFLVAQGTDTIFFNCATDNAYLTNGRPNARIRVKTIPGGYYVGLRTRAASGEVHFWNLTELTNEAGNWGMPFTAYGSNSTLGDNEYGIGVPACTESALTVGAYSSEYISQSNGNVYGGQLATFSSVGPLINGDLKPDISAPGKSVASSISSFTDASFSQIDQVDFNGRTYPFARFSGTSMSSPACAGIAALILDANPTLSPQQVKEIIIQTARTDNHTGAIPPHNTVWGWGKINAINAVKLALNTIGLEENSQKVSWKVFPNPTSTIISIEGLPAGIITLQIINNQGKVIQSVAYNNAIDVSSLPAGMYFIRIENNGKIEQVKFVKR